MNLKTLFEKYKNIIPYLFFGVCTTVVNVTVFWLMSYQIKLDTMPSTIMAWLIAVLFAYITNRKWVFKSEAHTMTEIVKELTWFFTCRLATGFVDWAAMYVLVELLGLNDILIKIVANFVVIVLNYVASKVFIFKKKNS